MNQKTGNALRIVAIVFMGLTAAMNLIGGIGTVCAAFLTKQFPPMWALYEYQWLYQTVMIITIIIGIGNVWATFGLVKGKTNTYRNSIILLVAGTIVAGVQVGASLALRGKAVPANFKLYTNALTLIIFILVGLPGVKKWVDFTKPGGRSDNATASGIAAIVAGLVTLSVFMWAGPSHTYVGNNWVDVLQTPLIVSGTILLISGIGLVIWAIQDVFRLEVTETAPKAQ